MPLRLFSLKRSTAGAFAVMYTLHLLGEKKFQEVLSKIWDEHSHPLCTREGSMLLHSLCRTSEVRHIWYSGRLSRRPQMPDCHQK